MGGRRGQEKEGERESGREREGERETQKIFQSLHFLVFLR